ncbi:hypothetical protein CQ059_14380 [Brucella pseudogrignonensis]|nr:hypothetical protein CQ059_14380 [Brucella pseudogrignonensis]PRA40040.1 hypothetical protein CQ063_14400 [Brucella pseudogrignonensis]PRA67571.1 hypothetical protein CQ055_14290 [Brucella pseudogrignonensis]
MRQAGRVTVLLRAPVPSSGTMLQLTTPAKAGLLKPLKIAIIEMIKSFKVKRMIILQTIIRNLSRLTAGGIAKLRDPLIGVATNISKEGKAKQIN